MNTNTTQNSTNGDASMVDATPVSPAPATSPTPAMPQQPVNEPVKEGISENTKTLVTVLLLIFVTPIGLIVMFFWPKWAWWVKLLITLPLLLIISLLMGIILIAVNPKAAVDKANCVNQCEATSDSANCVEMCSVPEPGTSLTNDEENDLPAFEEEM